MWGEKSFMMAVKRALVPVVFADRFFMAENSLAEIGSLGGYLWANARTDLELAALVGGSESVRVIVSEYVPIGAAVLERAPGLKGVIAYGAGYDHIDVPCLSRKGIQVCNCRGENAQAVAELTFALLLALIRRVHLADRWVREDQWAGAGRALPEWIMGRELWKKTLGIIGLGQIGSRVAKIASGFEMNIMAYDPFVKVKHAGAPASLEEVLAQSDIITLHVPFNAQTEKMIGPRQIGMMKPGSLLVNTSRGGVIDESSLIEALGDKRIRGAALDVFQGEPVSSGNPLLKLENVILSPHMGAMTQEAAERLSRAVTRQARDILEGRRPESLINNILFIQSRI